VKADVIRDVMFDETLSVGEDWDAFIRIAQKYRIGYLNEPLFIYHQVGQTAAVERMLSAAKSQSPSQLEHRALALYKHRAFLGEKWFNYHMARTLLSYIGRRQNRLQYIGYAIKRCGMRAVAMALADKARWRLWQTWSTLVRRRVTVSNSG
jgi:hypothetical protein